MTTETKHALKNPNGFTQTGKLTYENTEKYIDVKGVKIHYHEAGEEHPDTIVFIHGGGYGASGWFNFYLNVEPFAEHFRTILIDMPNFGRSDALTPKDRETKGVGFDSDVLSEFVKLKGLGKISIMGNSKGGSDAIRFSIDHNDQLDLNIIMGTSTGLSVMDPMPSRGVAFLNVLLNNPTRENARELLTMMVYDPSFITDEWVDLRLRGMAASDERGHREARLMPAAGTAFGGQASLTHRLHESKNPTLLVYGAHDRFAPLDSNLSIMRNYPNSEMYIFRNAGHWVQFELSEEFNDVVISWMKRKKAIQAAS